MKKPRRGRPRRKGPAPYTHVSARISKDLASWLDREAKARSDTRSGVVKQAIAFHRLHIERETGKT